MTEQQIIGLPTEVLHYEMLQATAKEATLAAIQECERLLKKIAEVKLVLGRYQQLKSAYDLSCKRLAVAKEQEMDNQLLVKEAMVGIKECPLTNKPISGECLKGI